VHTKCTGLYLFVLFFALFQFSLCLSLSVSNRLD
jgi:hypothetical protein